MILCPGTPPLRTTGQRKHGRLFETPKVLRSNSSPVTQGHAAPRRQLVAKDFSILCWCRGCSHTLPCEPDVARQCHLCTSPPARPPGHPQVVRGMLGFLGGRHQCERLGSLSQDAGQPAGAQGPTSTDTCSSSSPSILRGWWRGRPGATCLAWPVYSQRLSTCLKVPCSPETKARGGIRPPALHVHHPSGRAEGLLTSMEGMLSVKWLLRDSFSQCRVH